MERRARAPLAALLLALACAPPPAAPPEATAPTPPAPLPAEAAHPPPAAGACLRVERIVVHKGERRLWARCAGGAIVSFPVALGRAPEGAKQARGDQRTPEGDYRIAGPARPSRFHRFVPIDYPSLADADRALAAGRLSRRDHARIAAAHARGLAPPADTVLGGNLGFHGEGARWRGESLALDWTDGCIALADADLDFLAARIEVGIAVRLLGADAPLPAER